MKQFNSLSEQEKDTLLKFPAYIALLASDGDGKLDKSEEKFAIKFSHIKTFFFRPASH